VVTPQPVSFYPLIGFPMVGVDDDVAALTAAAVTASGLTLSSGDILVVTSKIVSKAEGCVVDLATVEPSARALELAEITGRDPRLVEVVLGESVGVSRAVQGALIVRHRLGFTSANAGIDHSNLGSEGEEVLLLPLDPDASARRIRKRIVEDTGVDVGIVISDTHGRPFRVGNVGVAIGVAGVPALLNLRGEPDLFGHRLTATDVPLADQLATAAGLISGEGAEGVPVVLVRGLQYPGRDPRQAELSRAADVIRPMSRDLYS
jgi:coenzyme F420-0:L-glutamate ligase/coenzyme F420-1:gamma-L-glutamate ligase